MTTAWQHTTASLHRPTFCSDAFHPLVVPPFRLLSYSVICTTAVESSFRHRPKADILSDTTTPQLTQLRPSVGTAPTTNCGALVPRPTNTGTCFHTTTTQRPSTPTAAPQFAYLASATVHPRLASHPQAETAIALFAWHPPCSTPIPRESNEPLPFGLGVFREPTNSQPRPGPLPTRPRLRQRNSVPAPYLTWPVPTENLCLGPLHGRRSATADSSLPLFYATCYQGLS